MVDAGENLRIDETVAAEVETKLRRQSVGEFVDLFAAKIVPVVAPNCAACGLPPR
jgi:hypothetical protein